MSKIPQAPLPIPNLTNEKEKKEEIDHSVILNALVSI
jgi:hypothetical protein